VRLTLDIRSIWRNGHVVKLIETPWQPEMGVGLFFCPGSRTMATTFGLASPKHGPTEALLGTRGRNVDLALLVQQFEFRPKELA